MFSQLLNMASVNPTALPTRSPTTELESLESLLSVETLWIIVILLFVCVLLLIAGYLAVWVRYRKKSSNGSAGCDYQSMTRDRSDILSALRSKKDRKDSTLSISMSVISALQSETMSVLHSHVEHDGDEETQPGTATQSGHSQTHKVIPRGSWDDEGSRRR